MRWKDVPGDEQETGGGRGTRRAAGVSHEYRSTRDAGDRGGGTPRLKALDGFCPRVQRRLELIRGFCIGIESDVFGYN